MRPITLILSGNVNDFSTVISPPITFRKNEKYEAAPLCIDTYFSFPNVTSTNNNFTYSTDNGSTWKTIILDKGSCQLMAINDE